MNTEQKERYSRHIRLPEIGEAGQEKLLKSRVLVIGTGGLGSPAAFYLAAAGLGTIGLADGDRVEPSNLQRQILHSTADIGRNKTESGAETIRVLNPDVNVVSHPVRLTETNAEELIAGYDFVIDAVDNFAARFVMTETCQKLRIPYCYGGISAFHGQCMSVLPGQSTCVCCLFSEAPKEAPETPAGPLGTLPGVIGTLQATEAIKYLLGIGDLLTDRLLTYDALKMNFRTIPVIRNPRCRLCGN